MQSNVRMVPTDLKYTTVASMVQVRALSGTGVSALGDLVVFLAGHGGQEGYC